MSEQKVITSERQFRKVKALKKQNRRAKMSLIEDAPIEWDRRAFLKGLGFAFLAVQCPALVGCVPGDPPLDEKSRENNLVLQSSPGMFDHLHELVIPYALLQTPPSEGVKLLSSKAFFHRHEIILTQDDLHTVSQGGSVTRKASSHLFVIALVK
jgi:hypothetical protein